MPIFEFECRQCHGECEVLVRNEEAPECPHCGSHELQKMLSVPAAHMRAGGGAELPVCNPAPRAGGCGAPWCGTGGCQN
ncbi:MAG: FmdB family zinc ribbon protein [Planctomycetota bacterium]